MKIGYARCSAADQNVSRQEEILHKKFGIDKNRIYIDMLSGKDTNRPKLLEMMDFVREGDILYVESISRLARSTRDLLNITDKLAEKGVQFVSEKENIDTKTPQGKFMMTVFAAMAELEREQMYQRQKEGIAIAKKNGKYRGRQPKPYDRFEFEELYKKWKKGEITQKFMCKRLDISRATLHRLIKKYEINKQLK